MRNRKAWLAVLPLGYLAFVACVGDDPATTVVDNGEGGSTPSGDSSTPSGDSATPPDGSSPADGGGADADAGPPPCGYPGELCCAAPAVGCRTGTTCSSASPGRCMVNEVVAIGEYFAFTNGGFPVVNRMVTAVWNGATWTEGPKLDTDFHPYGVWAHGPSGYRIALGKSGVGKYYFLEGVNWKDCAGPGTCAGPTGTLPELYGIISVDNNYWLGGTNAIYRCVAPARCTLQTTGLASQTWGSGNFTGSSEQDLWFAAITKAFHFDGTTWAVHPGVKAKTIYQVRKNDVWVGDQTLQHWNGAAWGGEMNVDGNPAPGLISSISGAAPNDLWAVGSINGGGSFAARWNGTEWKLVTLPVTALNVQSVYAPSTIEAFVGGDENGLFKWDGTAWTKMVSPTITPGANETMSTVSWKVITGVAKTRP
jgi:hypothetical protein